GGRLAARQTFVRGAPLREPEEEQRDEVARDVARRELAEETRLGLEARLHAAAQPDRDRLERLEGRGVVALRLGEHARARPSQRERARRREPRRRALHARRAAPD